MAEPFGNKALKKLTRIADIIAFKGLTIRWRFTLFFFGALFWYLLIAAIGIGNVLIETSYYQEIEQITNYDRTSQKIIRKLRGASISAHKIVLYDDIQVVNQHSERGIGRLDDVEAFIQSMLTGGTIRDYSKAIDHLFDEFKVEPVQDEERKLQLLQTRDKVERLYEVFNELFKVKTTSMAEDMKKSMLLERLQEIDAMTMEIVLIMGEFSSRSAKLFDVQKEKIRKYYYISGIAIIASLLIATTLLLIFLIRLSISMTGPISKMAGYIRDIAAGGLTVPKEYKGVAEKDEMGELFLQFESLVNWFKEINLFKKVIEEDYASEDIYFRLAGVFKEHIGIDNFIIYEISDDKNAMRMVYHSGLSLETEIYCNKDILVDCSLCRAKKTGHVVSSLDYPDVCRQFLFNNEKMHVCIPLIMGGNTEGVIQFVFDKQADRDMADKRVFTAIQYINAALPVIESKRLQSALRESSVRDVLTGLHNRRFLEDYIDVLISAVRRNKLVLGILMCDVDFFKEVNDTYGHDVGDLVLKETAKVIKESVRGSDIVVRFGGEEFLIILININDGNAMMVAEKIRSLMEKTKVKIVGGYIQKTISIGISEFPKDTEQFWEAIKFSDISMYNAKETGRNKVVRFSREMWKEKEY